MDYREWQETIQHDCPQIRNVRGGANCRDPTTRITNYCDFNRCPKVKDRLP
jgi:hypothetical protein